MPVLRAVTEVDAPPRLVAGVLRDMDAVAEGLGRHGHTVRGPARMLAAGDEVRFRARLWLGVRWPLRTRVTAVSAGGMVSELVGGPLGALEHRIVLRPRGDATTMTDELSWRGLGGLADPAVRRFGAQAQRARTDVLLARVDALRRPPNRVVVGTAIVRDGRVLAAQRPPASSQAGGWELPGGSVEAGETEQQAVVRECREELDTAVVPGPRLGTDLPISVGILRVYVAALAPGAAPPRAVEHADLRWVGPGELAGLAWLHADRALVPDLAALLRTG